MNIRGLLGGVVNGAIGKGIAHRVAKVAVRKAVDKVSRKVDQRTDEERVKRMPEENGKGQFGPRDRKQTVTVFGVTVGVLPIYNFLFSKLLGLAGHPEITSFFADAEVQYVALPILGAVLGYIASKYQSND